MLTQWGSNISADKVLNDYPRPQLVRNDWQNLNGIWQYAITSKHAPQPQHWDGEILVPFCVESPLSGVARSVSPLERLWYQRSFDLTDASERTLLHFGAVDFECTLWVNGGLVGAHSGGFDPFTFDLTGFVEAGENQVLLAVTDPTSSGDQPRGKQHLQPQQIWYTAVTGIWQTVWLEQVPANAHIEEVQIVPNDACDAIDLQAFLYRPSRNPDLAIRVRVSLQGVPVTEAIGRPDRTVRVPIPNPQRWSPDTPTLYDLEVTLLRISNPLPPVNEERALAQLLRQVPLRGETEAQIYAESDCAEAQKLDQVRSYFGLRRIEVGPHPERGHPVLLLNGRAVFHLGPLDQGWWPDGLQTPPSDEAMIYEIEYLKAAGFNTLRKHIKVEPARYYYHCDRLGILVWQDMPTGFLPAQFVAPNDEDEGLRTSRSTEQFDLELQRMINRLRIHPSIVVWVLHNEGWGQFDTARLTDRVRALDPSRVINSVSGWRDMDSGDIIDKHDYRPDPSAPHADGKRALVVGEYGGVAWPIENHLWNPEKSNWGYQTFVSEDEVKASYEQVTQAIVDMYQNDGVCGAIYTQTTDVEIEINGLITYDRAVEKLSREWLAECHAPLTTPFNPKPGADPG